MKKASYLTIFLITLMACNMKYVELYKTESNGLKTNEKTYIFENDTLKITYSFWANKGVMAFSIYNKSDKPIYIDWKKSNYISNSKKLNYYTDNEISKSVTKGNSIYYYTGFLTVPFLFSQNSNSVSRSITTKPERITFIPPKSEIYKTEYLITLSGYQKWADGFEKYKTIRNDNPQWYTTIKTKKFTEKTSPISFRNFLTFSMKEDFASEFYVDNDFYVKEIELMDRRHFSQDSVDRKGKIFKIFRFENGKDFFTTFQELRN